MNTNNHKYYIEKGEYKDEEKTLKNGYDSARYERIR